MAQDNTTKLVVGAVGAIATGFLLGIGFIMAQRLVDKRRKTATAQPNTNANFSSMEGDWGSDNWLSEQKANMLDDHQGNKLSRYAGFVDDYNYMTPQQPQSGNFDFTTGSWT